MTHYKFELPKHWSAQQAWDAIQLLDIISSCIWKNYEALLLKHIRQKQPKKYDPDDMQLHDSSYQYNSDERLDFAF